MRRRTTAQIVLQADVDAYRARTASYGTRDPTANYRRAMLFAENQAIRQEQDTLRAKTAEDERLKGLTDAAEALCLSHGTDFIVEVDDGILREVFLVLDENLMPEEAYVLVLSSSFVEGGS